MTEARIWYSRDPAQQNLPGDCQNVIVLSPEFYREISSHPIPTDLDAARALSCSAAALDLFMWLSYRCFTAKSEEQVPLFGAFRLVSQLGSAPYARPRKFREKLEQWLDLVRRMWPGGPARIGRDGRIYHQPGRCHPQPGRCLCLCLMLSARLACSRSVWPKSMRWFLPAWGRHACLAMRNRRHLTDKWLCTWQSTSAVGARPRLEGFITAVIIRQFAT